VIRVVAPFDNMTLVHRWMANQDNCQKLGSTPNRNNDHKCAYSGLANTAGSYDLGHDLLVDRYELGSDLTSRAGQTPRSTLTQQGAKLACELQSNLNLIGSGNVSKRILSRKEWMATASWPSGLTDAQITTTEEGILNSAECNGNSSQLDEAGNNTNCSSRYGSENHAGNAWEWVSDRVFNGTGVSLNSQRLIQSNTDLDGVNFGSLGTQLVETLPCLNLVTGLVENYSSGVTCPSSSVNLAAQTTVYSHNDYHISPGPAGGRQLLVGGSFQPTSNSGLFTNAWVSSTFNGGGVRCGIQVSY
jgi:hypothetical protein